MVLGELERRDEEEHGEGAGMRAAPGKTPWRSPPRSAPATEPAAMVAVKRMLAPRTAQL